MAELDPFVQPIPEQFSSNRELRAYFEYLHRWLHDSWVRSGGGNDEVAQLSSDSNRKADTLLFSVLDKVSLGDPLTSDTTGFTVDSTVLYADMTES